MSDRRTPDLDTNGIPGCRCSGRRGESCTRSGWVRCNERIQWLVDEAKRLGLDSWRDISWRTNRPIRAPNFHPTDVRPFDEDTNDD